MTTDNEPSAHTSLASAKVLVVVSAADRIPLREGGYHDTGVFLGELTEVTDALLEAGFALTFTSPGGKPVTIDKSSYNAVNWRFNLVKIARAKASYQRLLQLGLAHPVPLETIARDIDYLAKFDAVFVPGGHAPMVDLLRKDRFIDDTVNDDFGALLQFFHDTGRATGLICHAPAALAAAPHINGTWIYQGYRMTCVSTAAEYMIEDFPLTRVTKGQLTEYPSQILNDAGGIIEQTSIPMKSKVVEDRELLTGQDPFAAKKFGKRLVSKIRRARDNT
jgi:putative intracellular protease/amidase